MRQRLVNRATFGDLGEAFLLCLIEVAFNMDIARDLLDETLVRFITI